MSNKGSGLFKKISSKFNILSNKFTKSASHELSSDKDTFYEEWISDKDGINYDESDKCSEDENPLLGSIISIVPESSPLRNNSLDYDTGVSLDSNKFKESSKISYIDDYSREFDSVDKFTKSSVNESEDRINDSSEGDFQDFRGIPSLQDSEDLMIKYGKYFHDSDLTDSLYGLNDSNNSDESNVSNFNNDGCSVDNSNCLTNDFRDSGFINDYNMSNSVANNTIDNIKFKIDKFKKELNNNIAFKKSFGKIVFILIFLVFLSSILYFFVYQPFQEELNLEKNAKLNELNVLYCGPLEANDNAFYLKTQIEKANNIDDLKYIDVLMSATKDWRVYHSSKIVSLKDNFGRIMLSWDDGGDSNKTVLMSVKEANDFVKDNDAKILSSIQFKKVDTIAVPISLSRLQASAGLISVGSVVDVYSFNDSDLDSFDESNSNSQLNSSSDGGSDVDIGENNTDGESVGTDGDVNNLKSDSNSEDSAFEGSTTSENTTFNDKSNLNSVGSDNLNINSEPAISGATVLAILRSKDSGVIDSTVSKTNKVIKGNETIPYENSTSFSSDVCELLKKDAINSDNGVLESYLDSYGVKLSNFERISNLGDLNSEYMVLLEVPRENVNFLINNMDNLILTVPTEFAPSWIINELNETYYENIYQDTNPINIFN